MVKFYDCKMSQSQLKALCDETLITEDLELEQDENILSVEGVGFFAKGDLCAIKARQKHGKTTSIALMISAILKGQLEKLTCLDNEATVLYIDTEQRKADTHAFIGKIRDLIGDDTDMNRLKVFNVRKLNMDEKFYTLKYLITTEKPSIVFIDGIADMLENPNDIVQSKYLIDELTVMCEKYNTCIVCVLHRNKSNMDDNMRGHLGTILAFKSAIILQCKRENGMFTVSTSESRHEPLPSWQWMYNEEGDIEMLEGTQPDDTRKKKSSTANNDNLEKAVIDFVASQTEPVAYSQLPKYLIEEKNIGRSKAYDKVKEMISAGKICTDGKIISLSATSDNVENTSFVFLIHSWSMNLS